MIGDLLMTLGAVLIGLGLTAVWTALQQHNCYYVQQHQRAQQEATECYFSHERIISMLEAHRAGGSPFPLYVTWDSISAYPPVKESVEDLAKKRWQANAKKWNEALAAKETPEYDGYLSMGMVIPVQYDNFPHD